MFGRKSKKSASELPLDPPAPPPEEALRDSLGLYQRWYLELRLREEIERAARTHGDCALIAWQLGSLPGEPIDQGEAHGAGQIIARGIRSYDVLCRTDQRRFLAIIFDVTFEDASAAAHRVCLELQVATSQLERWKAGVASFGQDGDNGEGLIEKALSKIGKVPRSAVAAPR